MPSPALIAEYQTKLSDKQLLQANRHEFYALNVAAVDESMSMTKQEFIRKQKLMNRSSNKWSVVFLVIFFGIQEYLPGESKLS